MLIFHIITQTTNQLALKETAKNFSKDFSEKLIILTAANIKIRFFLVFDSNSHSFFVIQHILDNQKSLLLRPFFKRFHFVISIRS